MAFLEGKRLTGEQHQVHPGKQVRGELQFRIATARVASGGSEVDKREGAGHVGVARDGHPRVAPDQVQDAALREPDRRGLQCGQGTLERSTQTLGRIAVGEDFADQPIQGGVVARAERMGDDDVGNERR